jgi:hypothetical protein
MSGFLLIRKFWQRQICSTPCLLLCPLPARPYGSICDHRCGRDRHCMSEVQLQKELPEASCIN